MNIVVEYRCYKEQDIKEMDYELNKAFGEAFCHGSYYKYNSYWKCKFKVDSTSMFDILSVVGIALTHTLHVMRGYRYGLGYELVHH